MPRLSLLTYSLGAAMLCYGLALFVFGPCLTAMAATFEVPLGRLGLIFTAFSVGLLPSVLSVGYLSELVGKRLVLLVSVLLMATSCALFAAVSSIWAPPSFPLAMGAVVLLGIGAGGIEVLANAVVADDNQPSPGFALNVTHAFFAIGAVLGPLGAGAVLRAELPWQSVFYGAAGLFVVLFILLFPQREPAAQEAAFTLGAALRLLSSPLLLLLLAVLAMYVGAEAGLTVWVSPLMEEVLGSPRASAGMAVSIFWAFMVVGRLGVSFLAIRYRPAPMIVVLAVGSALSGVLVARAPSVFSCLVGSAASGLFMSGIFGLVVTDAARWFPQRTGAVFGLVIAGVGVGALFVPAGMGFLGGASGLRTAMLIPSALMVMVAGVYVSLWRR